MTESMNHRTPMMLVDPTSGPAAPQFTQPAERPQCLTGLRLAVINNQKDGAGELLQMIAEKLDQESGLSRIIEFKKSSSKPLDQAMIRDVVAQADVAVAGIGD
ncbi:MAG: hypothetical protein WD535_00355 [Thermaerobacterales bacterium]